MPNVAFDGTLAGWRAAARGLLAAGVAPDDAVWESADDAQGALALGGESPADPGAPSAAPSAAPAPPPGAAVARVPRRFLALAALVACHRDPARWGALYRVLWRLTRGGEPRLLAVSVDADVLRLTRMAKAVRRDEHKMHAFVRFRAVADAGGGEPEYVAWFEPEHDVVARAARFFARRFPNMRWSVLTPRGTARWDGAALALGPGVPAAAAPRDDSLEALWGVYYAHIFNPARVKLAAMRSEMPKRYWRNLPEARLIDALVRDAPARVRRMVAAQHGAPPAAARVAPPAAGAGGDGRAAGDPAAAAAGVAPLRVGGAEVRVGAAGWDDPAGDGAGGWYPDDARTADGRLRHDAARLSLAEAADAAAALPTRALAALWAARTPPGFVFDVRAHSLLAGRPVEPRRLPRRVRDLLPPSLAGANRVMADEVPARVRDAVWEELLAALAPLEAAGKLGAVLLRFPPEFAPCRASAGALAEAREALGGRLAAAELRDPEWLAPRVRARTAALLERLGFAHVAVAGGADDAPVTHPELAVVRVPAGVDAAAVVRHVEAAARHARAVHVIVGRRRGANAGEAARVMAAVRDGSTVDGTTVYGTAGTGGAEAGKGGDGTAGRGEAGT